jgi:hypothetical protein
MPGGRSPARKGRRVEQELVNLLLELGLVCERIPLSGAAGGKFTGDIHVEIRGHKHRVEVKARKKFDALHSWLAGADLLILKADRQPPLLVLSLAQFLELTQVQS